MSEPLAPASRATVLAVVVSAGITRYLPETLRGLAEQRRLPDAVLVVDVSGPDDHAHGRTTALRTLAKDAGLPLDLVRVAFAPEARNFGDGVRTGLELLAEQGGGGPDLARARWLWLLHDDSAPEPAALAELVRAGESGPSTAIVGSKQRDWLHPDHLVSVGVTVSPGGRRFTGVDDGELDQGQHDGREDVYAVGTAGALVGGETWAELGGTDPALGPFGDGLDLSRRARLAGYRVVVAPRAVVRHARASYLGLRPGQDRRQGAAAAPGAGSTGPVPPPAEPDVRRSFRARRVALLHQRFVDAPAWAVPLVTLLAVLGAVLRPVGRIATKEPRLAGDEVAAAASVLAHPGAIRRSRARARATRRLPSRRLTTLRASWRDVWRVGHDRRLQAAAARRARIAPSELEIAERAVLATRRRTGLAVLSVILLAAALVTSGPLLAAGALSGGALLPTTADLGVLWQRAVGGWVAAADGYPGPPDPLLSVLVVPTAVVGGSAQVAVSALVLASVPLAGLGAWFAAGAATRSVRLRVWAAVVWAFAPALLLGAGQGRLGGVVAHLALPWAALGVARALGVHRRDDLGQGVAPATLRLVPADDMADQEADGEADRESAAGGTAADGEAGEDARDGAHEAAADAVAVDVHVRVEEDEDDAEVDEGPSGESIVPEPPADAGPSSEPPVPGGPARPASTRAGAVAAAAGAGIALAVAAAGAPVLLPASLLGLLAVAAAARGRRALLWLAAVPPVLLLAPLLLEAARDLPGGSWRILLADPGVPLASDPGPSYLALLGWPTEPVTWPLLPEPAAAIAPLVAGAVVGVVAMLAFVRRGGLRPAVAGWLLVAVGLAAAFGASRVEVGLGVAGAGLEGSAVVRGWAGAGTSLVLAGLLVTVLTATDGLTRRLARHTFGSRQVGTVLLAAVVVISTAANAVAWTWRVVEARESGEPTRVFALESRAEGVPALGLEMQRPPQQARVLALTPTGDEVTVSLWRGDGDQLDERSVVVAARTVAGAPPDTRISPVDDADAALADLSAALAVGSAGNPADELAQHGVGVVLVPRQGGGARERLVAQLDATAGLERVTETAAGTVWRVAPPEGSELIARTRVVSADGTVTAIVPSDGLTVSGAIEAGEVERLVVLSERADDGWRATLDGRPLPARTVGWRQAFALGEDGGRLVVWYADWRLTLVHTLQAVVLGLFVLLALPLRRRRREVV